MKDKFIIFLDIDSVLCPKNPSIDLDGEHSFKTESIEAINSIIQYYNSDLGMISSWNSKFYKSSLYGEFLSSRGIIVNQIYILDSNKRVDGIIDFLDKNPEYSYLIIDDEAYGYYEACFRNKKMDFKRIIEPNPYRCLDNYDAYKAIKLNLKF